MLRDDTEKLQELDGSLCWSDQADLAIRKLAIGPTEISTTIDQYRIGDGAIFEVVAVHLDDRARNILICNDLHPLLRFTFSLR